MRAMTSRLALTLLVIVLSSPALAQDVDAAKTCKPGSTKGNCLLGLITTLQGQVAALQTALSAVQGNHALALGPFVSVDATAEKGVAGPNIIISGANVHIESGSGNTFDSTGLGNLFIGYDEDSLAASTIDPNRTGSHNLVVGTNHQFSASGGAVFGFGNFISSNEATVTGGDCNAAGATAFPSSLLIPCFQGNTGMDSVSGGEQNTSNGAGSSVSGGDLNTASGTDSSASGGAANTASGPASSVSAGNLNTASGTQASVSGGVANMASKDNSSVSGGQSNTASGHQASVSGGESNTASGDDSSILGGNSLTVSTKDGHSP